MRWLRIPFGINTAREEYQKRQTEHVSDFEHVSGVAVVVDGNLVFGCGVTMEKPCKDNNPRGFPEKARKIDLWFNSGKMQLWREELHSLGHLIWSYGLKLDSWMVAAIMKMRKPKDMKSMQWLVNYLANILPNLSTICEPLLQLKCKDASWRWQSEQEAAFKKEKQLVTAAVIKK